MQKRSLPQIKMIFTCKQDWNSMEVSSKGRFCGQCQQAVIDFRHQSYAEIAGRLKTETGLCGLFEAEQVEPELIPVSLEWFDRLKLWLSAVTMVLWLECMEAKAQTGKGPSSTVKVDPVFHLKDSLNTPQGNPPANAPAVRVVHNPTAKTVSCGKSKYYLSRRFPFIIRRNYSGRIMGRFRM